MWNACPCWAKTTTEASANGVLLLCCMSCRHTQIRRAEQDRVRRMEAEAKKQEELAEFEVRGS